MVQQHIFGIAECKSSDVTTEDAVLRFDAENTVRAIVFHLLDEHLARSVCLDTARRTVERLISKSIQPSIARRRWITMTNPQRLRWMLQVSQTTMRIGANEAVRLQARRSRPVSRS